jgi:hypothetical protein
VLVGVGVGLTGMVGVCVGVGVGLIGITGVGVGLIGAMLSINMDKPYSSPSLASGPIRISKEYSIPSRGVKLNIKLALDGQALPFPLVHPISHRHMEA